MDSDKDEGGAGNESLTSKAHSKLGDALNDTKGMRKKPQKQALKHFLYSLPALFIGGLVGGTVAGAFISVPYLEMLCFVWMFIGGTISAYAAKALNNGEMGIFYGAAAGIFSSLTAAFVVLFFGGTISLILSVIGPTLPLSSIDERTIIIIIKLIVLMPIGPLSGALAGAFLK